MNVGMSVYKVSVGLLVKTQIVVAQVAAVRMESAFKSAQAMPLA